MGSITQRTALESSPGKGVGVGDGGPANGLPLGRRQGARCCRWPSVVTAALAGFLLMPASGASPAPGGEPVPVAPTTTTTATTAKPGCTTYRTSVDSSPQGGYWAEGYINNTQVSLHIDTGASVVAVPLEVARSAGLAVGKAGLANTASDVISTFRTVIPTLRIGNLAFRNVKAAIIPQAPNSEVLLGMSALEAVSLHQEQGVMVLATEICGKPSAADVQPAAAPSQPDVPLRRSVRDCMGPNHVIDKKAMECMRGQ